MHFRMKDRPEFIMSKALTLKQSSKYTPGGSKNSFMSA